MDNKRSSELEKLIEIRKQIASGELKIGPQHIDRKQKKIHDVELKEILRIDKDRKKSTLHTVELPNGKNIKLNEIELKAMKRK